MYQIYQVGNGETIDIIAKKLGITVDELKRINGINDNITLMSGSYIIIPNNNMNQEYKKYIVKPGDNMYTIARENNIDLDSLLSLNGLNKNDYIYPNQEIIIPINRTYVTKENDTIKDIIDRLNIDIEKIDNLYVVRDQIISY
jgi:LysM repeat protein